MARFCALLSMYSGTAACVVSFSILVGVYQGRVDVNPWGYIAIFSAGLPAIITGAIDYAKLPKS